MGSIWINTLRWYGLSIDSWFISYECSIIRWFFHILCAIVKHSGEFYWGMVMNPKLMGWMTIPHHLLTMAHEPYLYMYVYIYIDYVLIIRFMNYWNISENHDLSLAFSGPNTSTVTHPDSQSYDCPFHSGDDAYVTDVFKSEITDTQIHREPNIYIYTQYI